MEWKEAVECAKEELGAFGFVNEDEWSDVVKLAKEILREEFFESDEYIDFCNDVVNRYEHHLNSRDWFVLRKQILKRDNHKCLDCGGSATTVHHTSYHCMKTIDEKKYCISLCMRCHKLRHTKNDIFKNAKIWISKSIAGFHTVYFCKTCQCQRTFSSQENPSIFKCDHCKTTHVFSQSKGDFE